MYLSNIRDGGLLITSCQSFARIAHAGPAQLSNCPGIGPTKVRRLDEAFNQPFRRSGARSKAKDSEHISAAARLRPPTTPRRVLTEEDNVAPRSPSPDWDIELDLNESDGHRPAAVPPWEQDLYDPHSAGSSRGKTPRTRQYSPDWDMDVDSERNLQTPPPADPLSWDPPAKKKRRPNVFTS